MSDIITLSSETESVLYLRQNDEKLASVIERVGTITYIPHEDPFSFLVGTIIGQMLSNKVADILYARLENLCSGEISPIIVSQLQIDDFRHLGISRIKASYILGMAEQMKNHKIDFVAFPKLPDEEIIRRLTAIKGIGIWTAKMYLMFVLNRQDVLPYEDGAFLQAFSWAYNTNRVNQNDIMYMCRKWQPYSSIAARYLYRALDMGLTKENSPKMSKR